MNRQQTNTAHRLYALYETLPNDVQKSFLEELVQKKNAEIKALAFPSSSSDEKRNTVILGVMEDAFNIPDDFDEPLSKEIINDFYSDKL